MKNIIYISHLSTNVSAGLNWSVPAGVTAQKKFDNVLWIDVNDVEMPHWLASGVFHHASEFGGLDLAKFPHPFNEPDMVVFEGFYSVKEALFALKLRKKDIPYVIIPRGSLTHQAMHNHAAIKKRIAHFLLFDSYVRHARAIQYLTEDECRDSGEFGNSSHYILPNGFNLPQRYKAKFSEDCLKAIFIGRLDMYHKGLDELLRAINMSRALLDKNRFHLDLYGPKKYDYGRISEYIISNDLSSIVELKGEISGHDKEDAILNADLFILPSRFEGHPMGLIEALAYGLPVMVTPGSNMSEEIERENCGWVCPETDANKLSITLAHICEQHDRLYFLSKNAREVAKKYDWNILAMHFHEKMLELLTSE